MTFPTPTSIEELLYDLKQIYDYYNGRWYAYEQLELDELVVDDKDYVPLTDAEITTFATQLASNKVNVKKQAYLIELNSKIDALTEKLKGLDDTKNGEIEFINSSYGELEDKINQTVAKRGLGESTALLNQLRELEIKKVEKKAEIENTYSLKKLDISAELYALQEKQKDLNERYLTEIEYEKQKIIKELKDERSKRLDEVFNYNNAIKEKRTRYANSIKQQKMNDNIRYIQIVEEGLSEEELDHIGYFKDVVVLCDAYFYTLDKDTAYELYLQTGTLQFYLKKYYSSMANKYLARKNST